MKSRVCIAILNFNGRGHLEKYLPSVLEFSPPELAELVIIDNGSNDDSVAFIKNSPPFKHIRLIELPKNIGFADGYNQGLKNLQHEFYLLLNSDVRVTKDWLKPMLTTMDKYSSVAICQPKLLSDTDTSVFDYSGGLGGWVDGLGIPFAVGRIFRELESDTQQYQKPIKLAWACGAALMIRSKDYWSVNGMDPYFFAHQEEIDMCWRLNALEREVMNCPESVVYHLGGGTLANGSPLKFYLNVRNNLIMLYKNLPRLRFIKIFLMRFMIDHLFLLVECFKGHLKIAWEIHKAYWAFGSWLILKKKDVRYFPQKKSILRYGYYSKTIITDFYLRRKRIFAELRW